MRWKTKRIENEWFALDEKNPRLKNLITLCDEYMKDSFHKEITLTEVFRTPEEQAKLYMESTTRPMTSPHTLWDAVDIRSIDLNEKEIEALKAYIETAFLKNYYKKTVIYHTIPGNAYHFHVQLSKEE